MTKPKTPIVSDVAPAASSSYSQAIRSGNLLVTSGYLGTHPDGSGVVSGGFKSQLRQALDNVTAVLTAAGCTWDDVIRINVSLTDIEKFAEMDRIYSEYVEAPYPARNTIGVSQLWGGGEVGIDVMAIVPAKGAPVDGRD